jgi:hypothetical protein
MAAATTDYFRKTGANTVTTLAAPGKALAATSITVGSTANYPTDTGITIGIRQVDSDGVLVAGTYSEYSATVTSGTTFAIDATPVLGSDQVYPAGSTTQVFLPVSSHSQNELVDGILEFANQDGTLQTAPVQAALGVTSLPSGGWDILNSGTPPTVATGYNKGNREYDLLFSTVDLSSTLSPGMRLKVDRTGTTPTQCTDLESSSSQYWSKSSPTGISFTDDFTCEAWVKLESYSAMTIVSRWNGTSGWVVDVNASGQVQIVGFNGGASNNSYSLASQSLPLNRWVHVAACLDMSTFTTAGSPIYIDGVSVPVTVVRGGTNPTALVQAGNLQVGARNGSSQPFDGKISDVRVWSAVRTATQIRDNMNQQLVGNESNLVAYFPLNGDANDLTSNANNLSANGGATATTVDHPMKDTEYAVITKVAYSAPNTTVTVFTGTDHNIPNMTLENPFYSTQSTPFGFPRDRGKWSVSSISTNSRNFTAATYSSLTEALSVPTGAWELSWTGDVVASPASNPASSRISIITLSSTALSGSTDENIELTGAVGGKPGATATDFVARATIKKSAPTSVPSQTVYTLYGRANSGSPTNNATLDGFYSPTIIKAECAYL